MKTRRLLAAAILLALVINFAVARCDKSEPPEGDQSWWRVEDRGEMIVAVLGDASPFSSGEGSKAEGFDIDMARAIAKELGVGATFEVVDASTAFEGVRSGEYDVAMSGFMQGDAGKAGLAATAPYYEMPERVITAEGSKIETAEELAGAVIGVLRGTTTDEAIVAASAVRGVKRYDTIEDAREDLKVGRIAAVIVSDAWMRANAASLGDLSVTDVTLVTAPLVVLTEPGAAELRTHLDEAIAEVSDSRARNKAVEKWLGER